MPAAAGARMRSWHACVGSSAGWQQGCRRPAAAAVGMLPSSSLTRQPPACCPAPACAHLLHAPATCQKQSSGISMRRPCSWASWPLASLGARCSSKRRCGGPPSCRRRSRTAAPAATPTATQAARTWRRERRCWAAPEAARTARRRTSAALRQSSSPERRACVGVRAGGGPCGGSSGAAKSACLCLWLTTACVW